ncbi:lipopolysaccharide biosynthesis protein [Pseudoclavibacter helvolus]|uniref:lipopolysaccharide biosynthesis protein n=1 Tax=Pseudoclavibacter helvolus TaxID=255205 RepID=UPI0024AE5B17|nr:lipopolysaccharide biosynthesis protein [Pseudoclavibacter helvolus]
MSSTDVADLGRFGKRGALLTLASQAARIAIQGIGLVVLARLLTPNDYGYVAVVLAIVGVAEVVRDFGLSSASIQAKTISNWQRSNLFWVNSGIGLVLSAIVFFSAPLIAGIYGLPETLLITQAIAGVFLFRGITTQYRADMSRRFQFGRLAVVDVGAQSLGLATAIFLAVGGYGFWALVGQQIVIAVAETVIAAVVNPWIPRLPSKRGPIRQFLAYGANLFGIQLLGYASRNVDMLVIGARFGAGAAGYYQQAFQIMSLPLNQISAPSTRVALPVLARLQDDSTSYLAFLNKGQTVMVNALTPVFLFASAAAFPLLMLAIGPQWTPSVPIFQVLALSGVFHVIANVSYWIFVSKGLTGAGFRYQLVSRAMLIGLVVGGSVLGVMGVAGGYLIGFILMWPLSLWWAGRAADLAWVPLLWNGCRSILGHLPAAVAAWLVVQATMSLLPVWQLLIAAALFCAVEAIVALLWPAFRRDLLTVASMFEGVLKRKRRK